MTRLSLAILLFIVSCCVSVDGLKILVTSPVFGRSHSQFLGNLADLYVRNGHEVVYFEPEIIDDDPVLKFQSSKLARVIKKAKSWEGTNAFASFQRDGWSLDHNNILYGMSTLTGFSRALGESCHDILSDEKLVEMLRAEKFDIGIAEFLSVCPYALYRKIGIKKYITASATPIGSGFGTIFGGGSITTLSHMPEFFTVPFDRGTFMFRLLNLFNFGVGTFIFNDMFLGSVMKVINQHYPDAILKDMVSNSSYVFINANEHIEFVRPMSLKFINIAGIGVPKAKTLPTDYQKFMDEATGGVVLVSFGSISQSHLMPPKIKQAFLSAFDQFPQVKFLWKYENSSENVAAGHPNVLTREWIPQVDVLNHKNLIGFITHGGMNSLTESYVYGVPTMCIPLFGDQTRNCEMSKHRGLSVKLEKSDVTAETLTSSLRELIGNKQYLKQAREIGQMLKKAPMSPEERVLRYTQFAAEFEVSTNLDDYGRRMGTLQFYNLDVFLFLISVTFILLSIVFFILKRLFLVTRWLVRLLTKSISKQKSE